MNCQLLNEIQKYLNNQQFHHIFITNLFFKLCHIINITQMDNIALWKLVSATIFGSSVTTIVIEMLKDFVKEWFSSKRNLKNKRDEKRDEKRIVIYEEIYAKLDDMCNILSSNEDIIVSIEQLETILREKNLYIENNMRKITLNCCDYFRKVINREINRDISKSQSFLSEYYKEYNK